MLGIDVIIFLLYMGCNYSNEFLVNIVLGNVLLIKEIIYGK